MSMFISGNGQYWTDKNGYQYSALNYDDVINMANNPVDIEKSKAPWLIPSSLPSRSHDEQKQNGAYTALWVDIDDNKIGFDATVSAANDILGSGFVAYLTKSATPDNEKMRIIAPIFAPVKPKTWQLAQQVLIDKMASRGIECDKVSTRTAQLCYLPNKGEHYRYEINNNAAFNPTVWRADIKAILDHQVTLKAELEAQRLASRQKQLERAASGKQSPIEAYNQAYPIEQNLSYYGYIKKGSRYLSPNSGSKTPGVVIKGERWISSHDSDSGIGRPNESGTSGDSFDLFTYYEHNNDRDKALKAAAQMFNINDAVKIADSVKVAEPPKQDQLLPKHPNELMSLPYHLGDLQAFIYNQMAYPSAATAGIAALATLTAFAQTNLTIDSRDGLGFNEYYLIQAPTGFGKEALRKPVLKLSSKSAEQSSLSRILDSSNDVRFNFSAPASMQGLHSILEQNRSLFFMADEFAEWLRDTRNNSHKQQTLGYLMQLYNRAFGTIEPGIAVTRQYEAVTNPRVSVLATSTSEAILENMTREHAESGAYNRWLMFTGDTKLPDKRYTGLIYEPEKDLVDYISWVREQSGQVTFSADGWKRYVEMDKAIAEPIKRKDGLLGGRLGEQAIKIAGLIALSDMRLEMNASDFETAFKIRRGIYDRTYKLAQVEGSISGLHKTVEAAEQLTSALRGKNVVYKSQLQNFSRKYKSLSLQEQKAVVDRLLSDGVLSNVQFKQAQLAVLI